MTAPHAPTAADAERKAALDAVIDAARAGDLPTARQLSRAALKRGFEHPLMLNLRALDHEEAGRFELALTDLRRAHVLAPKDYGILNASGLTLGKLNRPEEAAKCFEQAIALQPAFGPAWFNRGWSLEQLGRTAEAAASYAKAVELNPENAQGWANLALLAVKRGDHEATRRFAEKALALEPGLPTAELALAEAELKTPVEAEARLRRLLDQRLGAFDKALANSLLGDALDAQDQPAAAFAAYGRGNDTFRAETAPRFEADGERPLADTLSWMQYWADWLEPARWTAEPDEGRGGEIRHVFLMGFPRSGTTLAETILLNHPDVASLEERNTLYAGIVDFLGKPADIARLETATSRDLRRYRDDYWTRVRQYGGAPDGKIFIDKNPFNALKLPLIYKLFPTARIIFSIRDPRDVVLSCFRRRFAINASTYELLDIRRAAEFYAGAMRLAETLWPKQPMARYDLVYERLVQDLPGVAREACAFIGADWRDSMADIAARGRRGEVASASSAQIARGLFSDGAGQWRRYRDQMAPVLPILAPWVERFGYPAD